MDINELLDQQAPNRLKGDPHDKAYAKALLEAYDYFKDLDLVQLREIRKQQGKEVCDSAHRCIAERVIVWNLIYN